MAYNNHFPPQQYLLYAGDYAFVCNMLYIFLLVAS
jgi:hypothetical protein